MIEKQMAIIQKMVNSDPHYQQLLKESHSLGEEYTRICTMLPCADRDLLDQYISVCENMEYRKLCLALVLWAMSTQ